MMLTCCLWRQIRMCCWKGQLQIIYFVSELEDLLTNTYGHTASRNVSIYVYVVLQNHISFHYCYDRSFIFENVFSIKNKCY